MSLFFGFGGLLIAAYSGVTLSKSARLLSLIAHGIGLILILLSGFGILRNLGQMDGPKGWIMAKFAIWIYMGIALLFIKKKGHLGWPVALVLFLVGACATSLGIHKPF
jgi:hypothetical protein